jgi:hypothetical protein
MTATAERARGKGTGTWLLLLALTTVSMLLGLSDLAAGTTLPLLVLALAVFKGHLVVDYFMGLARVGGLWRALVLGWLLIVALLLATATLMAGR